jgi:hypothetical protein
VTPSKKETIMTMLVRILSPALLAAALSLGASGAQAQNYPWCAAYDEADAPQNCSFTSFEACMTTVHGIGGFCNVNTQYLPPAAAPHPAYRASRHIKHKES